MQFFWGVLLSDLQSNDASTAFLTNHRRLSRLLSGTLLLLGLTLASYPESHPDWTPWSHLQQRLLTRILPSNPDIPRFATGIGLSLITLGLHLAPRLRDALSAPPLLWLGRHSFAVYLLHGPLMRTVLVWMVYGVDVPGSVRDDRGEMVPGPRLKFPGSAALAWSLLVWIPLNYGAAVLWTGYVDPWCARVTERLVGRVVLELDEKGDMYAFSRWESQILQEYEFGR